MKEPQMDNNKPRGIASRVLSVIVAVISAVLFLGGFCSQARETITVAGYWITLVISFLFALAIAVYVVGEFVDNTQKISILGSVCSWVFSCLFLFLIYARFLDIFYMHSHIGYENFWYFWLVAGSLEIVSVCLQAKKQSSNFLCIISVIVSAYTIFGWIGDGIMYSDKSIRDVGVFDQSVFSIILYVGSILFASLTVLYIVGKFASKKHFISIIGCIGSWVFFFTLYFFAIELNASGTIFGFGIFTWPFAGILEIISIYLDRHRTDAAAAPSAR